MISAEAHQWTRMVSTCPKMLATEYRMREGRSPVKPMTCLLWDKAGVSVRNRDAPNCQCLSPYVFTIAGEGHSVGQSSMAQWRNQRVEVLLVPVRQSFRPAAGGQVRMIGQYRPYCAARLILTAEAPERRKRCLSSQPARLLSQHTAGNVSCRPRSPR